MKLINLDNLVFIGPGSEWFWTMVSGMVLAVTFVAIYAQLRGQRDAAAIEQMAAIERDWNAEEMNRDKLEVLLALRDGTNPAHLPPGVADLGDFWERIGYLVRSGHINRQLVNEYFSTSIRTTWARLMPYIRSRREAERASEAWEHFEWLAVLMADMDRKAGRTGTFDEAHLARTIALSIEGILSAIRNAEELRAVIVRPMSTAMPTPEVAPEVIAS